MKRAAVSVDDCVCDHFDCPECCLRVLRGSSPKPPFDPRRVTSLSFSDAGAHRSNTEVSQGPLYVCHVPRISKLLSEPEFKSYDALTALGVSGTGSATALPVTPFVQTQTTCGGCLNQVPLGSTSSTRRGRSFINRYIRVKAMFGGEFQSTAAITNFNVILFWDKAPNNAAALPAYNTVMNTQDGMSLPNVSNQKRFEFIRDWNITFGPAAATSPTVFIDELICLDDKRTSFTKADTTGLYPDMVRNALLMYGCLGGNSKASNIGQAWYSTRLYYTDE